MKSGNHETTTGRRTFLVQGSAAAAAFLAGSAGRLFAETGDPIAMLKLDYDVNALEPYLSAKTLAAHYNKHHAGYMKTAADLIQGTAYVKMTLQEIVRAASPKDWTADGVLHDPNYALYLNAVLAQNHNLYWKSLKPKGGGIPHASFEKVIIKSFGSYDAFREQFVGFSKQGVHGWLWLVRKGKDQIALRRSEYADNPYAWAEKPLACIDLWEHAFYLDYQNRFADYLAACVDHLLNWDTIRSRLESA